MFKNFTVRLFTLHRLQTTSQKLVSYLCFSQIIITSYSLYQALVLSPIDYQQGELIRIMYIHAPAAWLSIMIYSIIAVCSLIYLIWDFETAYIISSAAAPIGAVFCFITLFSGSLWGKPIWGVWWNWDVRLTSMLILFILYLSYIFIINNKEKNISRSAKPASCIALIGFIDIPIIKFSVNLWYSIHQNSSISIFLKKNTIHKSMTTPLLLMFISFINYFILLLIIKVHIKINSWRDKGQ